ncbi:MAG: 2-oxoacid:acceptor oxidoreductase family protein [Deltaproteobacteria bacterium]|nr:2-oxoacid:acceptor oxidoreductase family protein [Deltaproteobacteria bacterium]
MIKEEDRYEIRFGGAGGQGIITAAIVLAEAAGVYDGKYVCQTQSYGPEARGGVSKAEVIISNKVIDYPMAMKPDLLLAMNQASCDTYFLDLKPAGLLVVDSTLVDQIPTSRAVAIPFTRIAQKKIGKGIVANMVALGAVGSLSQVVSLKNLEAALLARVPKGTEKINREALLAGIKAAQQIDLNSLPRSITPEEEEV